MPIDKEVSDRVVISMEDVYEVLTAEEADVFMSIMQKVDALTKDPKQFLGKEAVFLAVQLAGWRTKMGTYAQLYKTEKRSNAGEQLVIRRRKDLLMTIFAALEENINTLKLLARLDAKMGGYS